MNKARAIVKALQAASLKRKLAGGVVALAAAVGLASYIDPEVAEALVSVALTIAEIAMQP